MNFIYKTWEFFQRLWAWLPILWRDRDFDYQYILIMLQFKLSRTRKHLLKHNIIANTLEIAEEIQLAEDMIQAQLDGNWTEEEEKLHEEKWGEYHSTLKLIDDPFYGKVYTREGYRVKAKELKPTEEEAKEQVAIWELAWKREEDNIKNLFTYIGNKIRGWWD